MPDELTPSTNIEKFLAKTAGESVELPEPATRIEKYLNKIASEQTITEAIDNWLDEHIDPSTGYVLDSTLTLGNAAPPASAVGDLKSAITQEKEQREETDETTASIFSSFYNSIEYNGNAVSFITDSVAIAEIDCDSANNVLVCGKNMFDDSYMKSMSTSTPHEFYGVGADFSDLPVYEFNNPCTGMRLSMSVRPESDLSMEMVLQINYTDNTNRKEYFYNFADTTTWLRKSISVPQSGKTVSSFAIRCTANTASKVYVKDIMLEKSNSLTDFEEFKGGRIQLSGSAKTAIYTNIGQNNIVSDNSGNSLTVKVSNESIPEKNKTDIATIKSDVYGLVATQDANVELNREVSSGIYGLIPLANADAMEITPVFDLVSGSYTVSHYVLSGSEQTATLVDTATFNIGDTATFSNVTVNDFYAFTTSGGYLKYRYDTEQEYLTKFAYISSGKAVDIADTQIAGHIVFKNFEPKVSSLQMIGKTVVFFGDSRTWYDGKEYGSGTKSEWAGKTCAGYQQAVKELTGCVPINKGLNGYTSAQICEQIKLYDFTGVYAVYLSGGVNDFIKSDEISLGTIQPIGGTFDTTTVYGAWQSAIEYLLTSYPELKIYIDTPFVCWNWYGTILPENIAEAKKNIAELYSIKCLDLYHESGINVVNRDYFYVDDISGNAQTRLHLNDYGNKWVGDIIGKYMLSY